MRTWPGRVHGNGSDWQVFLLHQRRKLPDIPMYRKCVLLRRLQWRHDDQLAFCQHWKGQWAQLQDRFLIVNDIDAVFVSLKSSSQCEFMFTAVINFITKCLCLNYWIFKIHVTFLFYYYLQLTFAWIISLDLQVNPQLLFGLMKVRGESTQLPFKSSLGIWNTKQFKKLKLILILNSLANT